MSSPEKRPFVTVHADESCLGNQFEGANPGGAGALVESRHQQRITRRDFALSHGATTNNRMALQGAIDLLQLLASENADCPLIYVSDSQYLVKGITEWAPNWERRGWRRKGGPVENLEMWQSLLVASRAMVIEWVWVKGHAGHVRNEYANDLAVGAAESQTARGELGPSGFFAWLTDHQRRGRFTDYDADADLARLEQQYGRVG